MRCYGPLLRGMRGIACGKSAWYFCRCAAKGKGAGPPPTVYGHSNTLLPSTYLPPMQDACMYQQKYNVPYVLSLMSGLVTVSIIAAYVTKKKYDHHGVLHDGEEQNQLFVLGGDGSFQHLVGAGARFAHGAHRLGQLHSFQPPIGPSQKGTGQQHWHQENSPEMGITSVSCSLN